MRVTFTIQGQLANLNDYTKAYRTNKFAGANLKKKMEDIISLHIRSQLKDVKLREPVYLIFEWFEPNRKRDLDNICFAKKFILDSLVKTEIIKGDSWRNGETEEVVIDISETAIQKAKASFPTIDFKVGEAKDISCSSRCYIIQFVLRCICLHILVHLF